MPQVGDGLGPPMGVHGMCHGSWSLHQMEQMHVELQQDELDEWEAPTACSPPTADMR